MAVYTQVSFDEASSLLQRLQLGQLQSMEGCAGGIENTNYFVTTDIGAFVLTLFERLTARCPYVADALPLPEGPVGAEVVDNG